MIKISHFKKWPAMIPVFAFVFIMGAIPVLGLTDDLTDDFIFSGCFCPTDTPGSAASGGTCGDTAAVFADVDGVDNGGTYGPYEIMVTFTLLSGEMERISDPTGIYRLYFTFFELNCGMSNCSVSDTCEAGAFVMHFVDLTAPGTVWDDPGTWVYTSIPHVEFTISNDGCFDYDDPDFTTMPPYQQARAYRERSGVGNIGNCDGGDCLFEDAMGVAEVYVRTDFCENVLDDLRLDGTVVPGNTPAGSDVAVDVGSARITFDSVSSPGDTTVTVSASGSAVPSNFTLCDPPTYYNIETTASYSGPIDVCIHYPDTCDESGLRLLHNDGGSWIDVTTSLDTSENIICGEVSSFSEFIIGVFEDEPECSSSPGDLDGDDDVDNQDIVLFLTVLGTASGDPDFDMCADLDNDGRITMNDYRILRNLY